MIQLATPVLRDQFVGPAAQLLAYFDDSSITDILVNGCETLYVEKEGRMLACANPFETAAQLTELLDRIVAPLGKRVDAARPFLDGVLADGSRFHLILPPLADPGPALSIRKFSESGAVPLDSFGPALFVSTIRRWVAERRNFIVGGATGAGKTTLLGRLLDEVSPDERVILLEECPEIRTQLPQVVRLVARPATPDGRGEVTVRDLVRNSLRMRPDRLVVGECRGAEALDFLQAMSTGHSGCMGTLHARGCRDILQRLETLVALSGVSIERTAARHWISHAVEGVAYLARTPEGRAIREMAEVRGWEGEHYRLLPIELET